jgi:hypothetical protein
MKATTARLIQLLVNYNKRKSSPALKAGRWMGELRKRGGVGGCRTRNRRPAAACVASRLRLALGPLLAVPSTQRPVDEAPGLILQRLLNDELLERLRQPFQSGHQRSPRDIHGAQPL